MFIIKFSLFSMPAVFYGSLLFPRYKEVKMGPTQFFFFFISSPILIVLFSLYSLYEFFCLYFSTKFDLALVVSVIKGVKISQNRPTPK